MNLLLKVLFLLYTWILIVLCRILRICFFPVFRLFPKGKKRTGSVLILATFYPGNAGYHYRAEKWAELWRREGIKVDIFHTLSREKSERWSVGDELARFHLCNMSIRFWHVIKSLAYERVVVRRSLLRFNDYGRLYLDKLLLSVHPEAVLDFDDDLTNNLKPTHASSLYGKLLLEDRFIFYRALKLYRRFTPGSEYLAMLLRNNNLKLSERNYLVVPSCVDYEKLTAKDYGSMGEVTTLVWIGSDGNQVYLDDMVPQLNEVHKAEKIELLVISGKEYQHREARFSIRNVPWSLESETSDLYKGDIGIMPIKNDKMSRAKCGFKLIQYMGLGLVSVASAVTTNNRIVEDGVDGFLVREEGRWAEVLLGVIKRKKDFPSISAAARKKILEKYSFKAHYKAFSEFLHIDLK